MKPDEPGPYADPRGVFVPHPQAGLGIEVLQRALLAGQNRPAGQRKRQGSKAAAGADGGDLLRQQAAAILAEVNKAVGEGPGQGLPVQSGPTLPAGASGGAGAWQAPAATAAAVGKPAGTGRSAGQSAVAQPAAGPVSGEYPGKEKGW
jgi:hypothetical protein